MHLRHQSSKAMMQFSADLCGLDYSKFREGRHQCMLELGGTIWNFGSGPHIKYLLLISCDYLRLFNLLLSTSLLWVCFLRGVCLCMCVVWGGRWKPEKRGCVSWSCQLHRTWDYLSCLILIFPPVYKEWNVSSKDFCGLDMIMFKHLTST